MTRRALPALLFAGALTLLAAAALAHGGAEHVLGTVKQAEDRTLTVETREHRQVQVLLDDDTRFERSGQPATRADLQPGERVVVHAKRREPGAELHAAVIMLGKPARGASAPHGRRGPAPEPHPRAPPPQQGEGEGS